MALILYTASQLDVMAVIERLRKVATAERGEWMVGYAPSAEEHPGVAMPDLETARKNR